MNLPAPYDKWLDRDLYPFDHKFISLEAGILHYIDEGEGDIILFVHGTPTWSFLYREFIKSLSTSYRCLAIDHIGFGLSDKPEHFDGTPQSHSKNLDTFIEHLNLTNITLVVHDFGGPIGLSAAIKNHDRIKQIVVFNTWLWATKDNPATLKIDRIINNWIGKFLYLYLNFSAKVLLRQGYDDKKKLTRRIHKQYISPFPNKKSRRSLLNLAKTLVGSSDWYQKQWEALDVLANKPWLFLWGTKDEFITMEYLQKWKNRLPNAMVKEFVCGHFVQEENPVESIRAIDLFLKSNG